MHIQIIRDDDNYGMKTKHREKSVMGQPRPPHLYSLSSLHIYKRSNAWS